MSKKIILLFVALIFLMSGLLYRQILRTASISTKTADKPLISAGSLDIPLSDFDPVLGNPGAPMTIVEFLDLKDTASKKIHQAISQFVLKNPTKVRLFWKHLPNQNFLSNDAPLHYAAYCAQKQNHFWDFVSNTFANNNLTNYKGELNEQAIKQLTSNSGANSDILWNCAISKDTASAVDATITQTKQLGLKIAPALFINNKMINLDENFDLAQMLESFIQE